MTYNNLLQFKAIELRDKLTTLGSIGEENYKIILENIVNAITTIDSIKRRQK